MIAQEEPLIQRQDDMNFLVEDQFLQQNTSERAINEYVEKLCKFIVQEKGTPTILPYQNEILEGTYTAGKRQTIGIIELVHQQEEGIQAMKAELAEMKDHQRKQVQSFYLLVHVIELERVKFLLKEYLRTRLAKMEKYMFYITNNDLDTQLSHPERNYLKKYVQQRQNYYMQMCLRNLPSSVRQFGLGQKNNESQRGEKNLDIIQTLSPPLQKCVMVRITTQRPISLGTLQLKEGDVLFLPYQDIQKLHQLDYVQLL